MPDDPDRTAAIRPADTTGLAVRLIAAGIVDDRGEVELARRCGCSVADLRARLRAELRTDPIELASAQRARTARLLFALTEWQPPQVAFAAGFESVSDLTAALRSAPRLGRGEPSHRPTAISLRLPVRPPFAFAGVFGHLAACAVTGCEEIREGALRRTLRLHRGTGIVALRPHHGYVRCELSLTDGRDLSDAVERCRRLLDLDTDPSPIIEVLSADPALRAAVRRAPGQRIPGTVDGAELAIRVVLSQQVSLKAAATHTGRLLRDYGEPISDPDGGLTHVFPTPDQLVALNPDELAMPRTRRNTLLTLIRSLAEQTVRIDPTADPQRVRHQLLALPGVGPWTVELIAMRGLGDPDAFPGTDLGIRNAAAQLGLPVVRAELDAYSQRWRPWRSYATQHLWTALDHAVNQWPPKEPA